MLDRAITVARELKKGIMLDIIIAIGICQKDTINPLCQDISVHKMGKHARRNIPDITNTPKSKYCSAGPRPTEDTECVYSEHCYGL